jgi:hypothetical protein
MLVFVGGLAVPFNKDLPLLRAEVVLAIGLLGSYSYTLLGPAN